MYHCPRECQKDVFLALIFSWYIFKYSEVSTSMPLTADGTQIYSRRSEKNTAMRNFEVNTMEIA